MKCLVTGCAGFIGSHLSEALLDQGHSVLGVDCFSDYYSKKAKLANLSVLRKDKRFDFATADLSTSSLTQLVKGVGAVFHLAAQPGVRASWGRTFSHYVRDNIVATQRLLEAVKEEDIDRFVYASSSSIYGDAEQMPTREDATPRPVSPYGATKLAGEQLAYVYLRNFAVPVVTLRYFTVYGPRQRPDMAIHKFVDSISRGKEILVYGDGEQRRDFTFVRDIVEGTTLALKAEPGSTYNIGAGKTVALNDVIKIIERTVGKSAKIERETIARGDVRDTSADISRAADELGYHPRTSIDDGLRLQVEHHLSRRSSRSP